MWRLSRPNYPIRISNMSSCTPTTLCFKPISLLGSLPSQHRPHSVHLTATRSLPANCHFTMHTTVRVPYRYGCRFIYKYICARATVRACLFACECVCLPFSVGQFSFSAFFPASYLYFFPLSTCFVSLACVGIKSHLAGKLHDDGSTPVISAVFCQLALGWTDANV